MDDKALQEDDEDLAGTLECCTRELSALCHGLELQQIEAEDDDYEEVVGAGLDTLSSLEEIQEECTALLACLEAENHSSDDDDQTNKSPEVEKDQTQQIEAEQSRAETDLAREIDSFANELNKFLEENQTEQIEDEQLRPETELAHELDSFADDLNEFLSCLIEDGTDKVEDVKTYSSSPVTGEKLSNIVDSSVSTAPVVSTTTGPAHDVGETSSNEVFSERTKKAIALHIKRQALQKQRRSGIGGGLRVSTGGNDVEIPMQQSQPSGSKVVWSKYQSTSFQQHIIRQKFARRRLKQIKETERLVESARLRGPKPKDSSKSSNQATPTPTYLNQFKSNPQPSSECEPQYLCAVYLYGNRRLGTTYITFSSLFQLEQRILARFSIGQMAGIYREVTEILPETSRRRSNKLRSVKRLKRISMLENVTDGDTLCVTQNAYDDMTILCDWIKQRQYLVHEFEFKARQSPIDMSSEFTHNGSTLASSKIGVTTKPQLWDSNGRSIGVNTQYTL
ncbi:hypothetical protein P3T76_003002 [Phytophthora citrophthora]|uniref:Uncharacterized protein n=1 Tax=Phytophthora citrophthora TaxID=4793 RepID=A0AAD9LTC4_9STRA|nr:hypothetical protein P3T76_003002 [Phytophthora citrophthora]